MKYAKISTVLMAATILHLPLYEVISAAEEKGESKPEVTLEAGTQNDVETALVVLRKFLNGWESQDYATALTQVYEPLRKDFEKEMKNRKMKLQVIEDIRVSERRGHLRARIHIAADPDAERPDLTKRVIGIDMIQIEGKWWISA